MMRAPQTQRYVAFESLRYAFAGAGVNNALHAVPNAVPRPTKSPYKRTIS